jgi:hypothetical protein
MYYPCCCRTPQEFSNLLLPNREQKMNRGGSQDMTMLLGEGNYVADLLLERARSRALGHDSDRRANE